MLATVFSSDVFYDYFLNGPRIYGAQRICQINVMAIAWKLLLWVSQMTDLFCSWHIQLFNAKQSMFALKQGFQLNHLARWKKM